MNALPERGPRRAFKRALIDFFCAELEVGQSWSCYAVCEEREKVLIVRDLMRDSVYYTINDHWYYLSLREFVERRLDGRIRPMTYVAGKWTAD